MANLITNDILRQTVAAYLDLRIGEVRKVKDIWHKLVNMGYREDLIRFLEVLEVRYPKEPFIDPGTLAAALGATDGVDHNETRFKIMEYNITQVEESERLEDKGKYKVECFGVHYLEEKTKFAEKPTMIFSIKLT